MSRERALTTLLLKDFEESANDWLWEIDAELRLRHVSNRLAQVTALSCAQLIGLPLVELLSSADDDGEPIAKLFRTIAERGAFRDVLLCVSVTDERRWWRLSGKPILMGTQFAGYRGVGSDVTISKQAEDRIARLVLHDALTDLPNRACFNQELAAALGEVRQSKPIAVFCLDLDEFKDVNDTLGHDAGDRLLKAAALRLRERLSGRPARLSRLGGDEFAILVSWTDGRRS